MEPIGTLISCLKLAEAYTDDRVHLLLQLKAWIIVSIFAEKENNVDIWFKAELMREGIVSMIRELRK